MLVFAQSQECVPTLLFRSWLLPASDSSMYRIKRQHKALSPEVIRSLDSCATQCVQTQAHPEKLRHACSNQSRSKKIYVVMGLKTTTTAYQLY